MTKTKIMFIQIKRKPIIVQNVIVYGLNGPLIETVFILFAKIHLKFQFIRIFTLNVSYVTDWFLFVFFFLPERWSFFRYQSAVLHVCQQLIKMQNRCI